MGRRRLIVAGFGLCIVVAGRLAEAAPLGTVFIYQGQLKQGGAPVNVPVDLQFSLWDAAVGGGPVRPTETKLNVNVSNGLFTVDLNFGEGVFTGAQRWLQIAVRSPAGVDPYTTLSTRQPLTAAPYSLFSLQAGNTHWATSANHIYSTNAGNVGIGTTSPGRKLQIGDNTVSNSEGMIRLASRSGTQGSNRIWDIGVPETDADSSGFGYSFVIDDTQSGSTPEFMVKFGSGHVGIGTITPASPLHVYKSLSSTAEGALRVETRYMAGSFALSSRLQIEKTSVDAYGSLGDAALHLNPNSSGNVLLGEGGGNVGIDIGTPAVKLHVEGGTDVSPGGGGFLQLGSSTSTNIAIDNNEIMARNNGAAATLALNASGGNVTLIQSGAGGVAIGTTTIPTGVLLAVDGKVLCEEMEVQLSGDWPDYVFADDYALLPLEELEQNLAQNGHLPGIPSAAEVEKNGVNVGKMQTQLLEKVEELTLYMILMNKQMERVEQENRELKVRLTALEGRP